MPKNDLVRRIDQRPHSAESNGGAASWASWVGYDDSHLLRRDGTRPLRAVARWTWEEGAEINGLLRAGDGATELIGTLFYEHPNGKFSGILGGDTSADPIIFFAGANALDDIGTTAPLIITNSGTLYASKVEITSGAGITLNDDGLRIGGAGASALWGGEIYDIIGGVRVGTGIHGLRLYDRAGVPTIAMLTLKEGTDSPYFRLGRPTDAHWFQWDETGCAMSGRIVAGEGLIGGWGIGLNAILKDNAVLHSDGYVSFGTVPPGGYGDNVGAWLGYDSAAKLSLYADASNYLKWDGGKLLVKAANFELDALGNLVASNAVVSGVITATSGLFTGTVQVGTAYDSILIDGDVSLIKSSNYTAGLTGWQVDRLGNAEFNSITARGTLKSVVFEKSLVSAFAGSQIVAKSASVLYENVTVLETSFKLKVEKQAGAAPFEASDILRMKTELLDAWVQIFVGLDDGDMGDYYQYSAILIYGNSGDEFEGGQTIVDYGNAGDGFFAISADGLYGAGAAWVLAVHGGMPWDAENLSGFGVRRAVYAGTDGYLVAAEGTVRIGEDGISIEYGSARANAIDWYEGATRVGSISCMYTFVADRSLVLTSDGIALNGSTLITGTLQHMDGDLGFFMAGAQPQYTTAGEAAVFTANSGTTINDASTFDGYTLQQVVKALRNYGLLA